ncbi:hypothetical protein [Nocardiopsis eucommiae]|uniref:hypothetical protein n=1 Tax=Nocardiopsis eucommiae TaxID=2831970 RepID=UPI003D722560
MVERTESGSARARNGAVRAERGPERTAPAWLGRAAAGALLVLGVAHLVVTGWLAADADRAIGPGYLVWMVGPLVVTLGTAVAALALVRPGAPRWLGWVTGTAAVLCFLLTLLGFSSLAFGASPVSLFLGPGPYALPGTVFLTALTLRAWGARRAPATP